MHAKRILSDGAGRRTAFRDAAGAQPAGMIAGIPTIALAALIKLLRERWGVFIGTSMLRERIPQVNPMTHIQVVPHDGMTAKPLRCLCLTTGQEMSSSANAGTHRLSPAGGPAA